MTKRAKLTARRIKAIRHIVACSAYTEGCEKAKLNRTPLCDWLREPDFKAELDRQRDEVAAEAFGVLSQGLTKAVETLVGSLDNKDDRLRRLIAKDIIEHFLKYKEVKELEERVAAIEQRLDERR